MSSVLDRLQVLGKVILHFCLVYHLLPVQGAKLELVEAIRFNASMASTLCSYHALNGSWKAVLQDLQQVMISIRLARNQGCGHILQKELLAQGPREFAKQVPKWTRCK